MKVLSQKILFLLVITLGVIGCKNPENISVSTNFDRLDDKKLHMGDKLPLEFSSEDATIDSFTIRLNDKIYNTKEIVLDSANIRLGSNYMVLTLNYNGKYKKDIDATFTVYSKNKEKEISYKIIQEYPHNPELFTQGFIYNNGVITESSGQYGKSQLVRYPLGSTSYTQSVKMDPKIFAEGFAILNKKIYLLSWRERIGFIYDVSDLKQEKEFAYPETLTEGWGAASIGNEIVVSDGSAELKFFDENFTLKKKIEVVGYDHVYYSINELEYANGYIYANVFEHPIILVIDPKTGVVIAKADFSDLVNKNKTNEEAVLNGIAHMEGDTFLITGKLWSKIYKVELKF